MNKLLVALIAGALATIASAQTTMPGQTPADKTKQSDVRATTQAGSGSSASTQKTAAEQAANVKASKEVSKMTRAEKEAFAKEINKQMINPENPSGNTSTTAMQQKANTAESKAIPKQNAEFKTKEGKKELSKDLEKKATP